MGNVDVLAVRVDKLEETVDEIKQDIKSELKDIRESIKKNEEFYNENITYLRENLAVLTTIAKGHEVQINELKKVNKPEDEDKKWYRELISQNHKWLWYLIGLVTALLAGAKWDDIASFLHK